MIAPKHTLRGSSNSTCSAAPAALNRSASVTSAGAVCSEITLLRWHWNGATSPLHTVGVAVPVGVGVGVGWTGVPVGVRVDVCVAVDVSVGVLVAAPATGVSV